MSRLSKKRLIGHRPERTTQPISVVCRRGFSDSDVGEGELRRDSAEEKLNEKPTTEQICTGDSWQGIRVSHNLTVVKRTLPQRGDLSAQGIDQCNC